MNRGRSVPFGPDGFNGKLASEAILEMGKIFKALKNLLFYVGVLLKFFPIPVVPKLQLEGVLGLPFPTGCPAKFAQ